MNPNHKSTFLSPVLSCQAQLSSQISLPVHLQVGQVDRELSLCQQNIICAALSSSGRGLFTLFPSSTVDPSHGSQSFMSR